MGDPRLAGASIVDAMQSVYSKSSRGDTLDLICDTIADLCVENGLRPSDVDGLAVSSFLLGPDNVVTVAERLGMQLGWAHQGAHGGASGVVSLLTACEAVTAGRANTVICVGGDSFDVASHMRMLGHFNTAMRDFLAPYGFGGTNGLFALVEQEHRSLFGTSREQLGHIAVSQRKQAQLNENALLRGDLSMEDYLTARPIADPIRLYDCVLPCAGADAILLTSRDRAQLKYEQHVTVLSAEQVHNHRPTESLSLTTGAAAFSDRLFESAGVSRDAIDFVQLYDDYPIMVVIQLEDLGFTDKGGGGPWVAARDLSSVGDFPLNTGGGQLSCGQAGASGGMIGLFEAATQLLGRAGARQVPAAQYGLVSGFGMVGYGRGLSSAAAVLRREDLA